MSQQDACHTGPCNANLQTAQQQQQQQQCSCPTLSIRYSFKNILWVANEYCAAFTTTSA
jgi:hypothetical protein